MQDNTPEAKVDPNLAQDKVDTNTVQNEVPVDKTIENEPQEDPNYKSFREARKKDREEKNKAILLAQEKEVEISALKAAMEAAFSKQQTNVPENNQNQYSNYGEDESEDERIEKKVQAALAKRDADHERYRQQIEQQEYPQRLANQ